MSDREKYPFLASGSSPAALPAARSASEAPQQDPSVTLVEELRKEVREDAKATGVQLEDTESELQRVLQEEAQETVTAMTHMRVEEQADMKGSCVSFSVIPVTFLPVF